MKPLGWLGIARLGLVQSAIGAVVVLATALLNRVMVVEYALPAVLPAGLVAWHYGVQLSRPVWGHRADTGGRRTPWLIGGMAVLGIGSVFAALSTVVMKDHTAVSLPLAIAAYALIGAGAGAAGTTLLTLLATRVAPARRAGAASLTWVMMIFGFVVTEGVAGSLLDPFSPTRLLAVVGGAAVIAFVVATLAIRGVEQAEPAPAAHRLPTDFAKAVGDVWHDPIARTFTVFVFVSMLAYSMQDMILEPFSGLVFRLTAGQSTHLSGLLHMGVLAGMVLVGILGGTFAGGGSGAGLRHWAVGGCVGSALALAGLALAAQVGPGWPLALNVALLGFANGVFAVAAIGAMMALAGAAGAHRTGVRMGIWGAAQAVAFGLGGLTGAAGVAALRAAGNAAPPAFAIVFGIEATLFLGAAWLAFGAVTAAPQRREAFA